jgi:membrane protease YdiL (CAAX protease family)
VLRVAMRRPTRRHHERSASPPAGTDRPLTRTVLVIEVVIVLAMSLGRSAVYAIVDLISSLTAPGELREHTAVLNPSLAPGRPWLDLTLQLLSLAFGLVPVALSAYLLYRTEDPVLQMVGLRCGGRRDLLRGAALAAAVGTAGLGFYLLARTVGINLTVVADDLPGLWWHYPILVLSALQNSVLEEFIVVGYLLTRLRQIGLSRRGAVATTALVRGSYHLYQGFGGFLGNVVMGLLFGWLYTRWGRLLPLMLAHALIDTTAFVGYALLAGRVGWLH